MNIQMEVEWAEMSFETKPHRNSGTSILKGIDEIQQLLDDHIVKTQVGLTDTPITDPSYTQTNFRPTSNKGYAW